MEQNPKLKDEVAKINVALEQPEYCLLDTNAATLVYPGRTCSY